MEAQTVPGEAEEFDPHSVEAISAGNWEAVIDRFTEDMDPWAVDIVELADRYKSYVERLEEFDLKVPGRVIYIGAVLLRMKAELLRAEHDDEAQAAAEEVEDMFGFDEEELEPVEDDAQLRIPDAVPTPPVKKRGRRKVTLDELRDALEQALAIEEDRSQREEERHTAEDYGIEVDEHDITDRLNQLYSTLRDVIGGDDAVTFSGLVDREEREDAVNTFVHLMHLETEERVRCRQEEFLGELEIEVLDDAAAADTAA